MVTVEKRYVEVLGLILSHSTASVTEGETLTLIATVAPEDVDDKTVTWETSDASIATVEDGVITGVSAALRQLDETLDGGSSPKRNKFFDTIKNFFD